MEITSANLRRLLGTLPQELYDEIYDLTFTAPAGAHLIDEHWRFPVQLHVSKATRQKFAQAYFRSGVQFPIKDTICLVPSGIHLISRLSPGVTTTSQVIAKWLGLLELLHLACIRSLRLVVPSEEEVQKFEPLEPEIRPFVYGKTQALIMRRKTTPEPEAGMNPHCYILGAILRRMTVVTMPECPPIRYELLTWPARPSVTPPAEARRGGGARRARGRGRAPRGGR